MTNSSPRMAWPFPARDADPWYDDFDSFVQAVDSSGFAHREDRSIIWAGGGTLTWTAATGTFTWSATINIYSPIGSRLLQIASSGSPISGWDEGEVVYVTLTRHLLENSSGALVKASQLPSNNNAMAFGVRIGDTIYLRTGISLSDGSSAQGVAPVPSTGAALTVEDEGALVDANVVNIDFVGAGVTATQTAPGNVQVSVPGTDADAIHDNVAGEIAGITLKAVPTSSDLLVIEDDAAANAKKRVTIGSLPGLSTDRYTSSIIVGNSPNGDTINNCHYLDTGDGVQLQAALAAASAGDDVYIRPGTYNLGSGAAVAPLQPPSDVRIRGAGRQHTFITTKPSGDQGAFLLQSDNTLEDLLINASLPIGAGSGSTAVIAARGSRIACRRVSIEFPGVWTPVEAAFTVLRSCFESGNAGVLTSDDCEFVDCHAGIQTQVPWLLDLGLPPGQEMIVFAVRMGLTSAYISTILKRCISNGGDWAAASYAQMRLIDSSLRSFSSIGAFISGGDASGCEVADNHIVSDFGGAASGRGVVLSAVTNVGVVDNYIMNDTPVAGQQAIELLNGDYNTIRGNRGPGGLIGAVSLDASSGNNVVVGNNFTGATYSDLGTLNDLAHNK